jgi:hypothetical protein
MYPAIPIEILRKIREKIIIASLKYLNPNLIFSVLYII